MTKLLAIVVVFVLVSVVGFFVLGWKSKAGHPPGLVDGRLARCPATPNCVCSEYPDDAFHFIEPVAVGEPAVDAMSKIKAAIVAAGGTIHLETAHYVGATFTSAVFRFVDDVEARIDEEKNVVHIRSASRVGRGDMGVNQKRVEQLRKAARS